MTLMRTPSLLTLGCVLPLLLTVTACGVFADDKGSYGGEGPYYGSSGYGSSGYGYPYDAGRAAPECAESFAVAFALQPKSGDCKLVITRAESPADGAIYYFAEPDADAPQSCEVLDGPLPGRCTRAHDVVALGSTSPADASALRDHLRLARSAVSFTAILSCARLVHPIVKEVSLKCASASAVPTPATNDGGVIPDATIDQENSGSAPGADAGGCPPPP